MKFSVLRNAAAAASLGLLMACSAQAPEAASNSDESAASAAPAPETTPAPAEAAAPAETAVAATDAAPAATSEPSAGEAAYKKTCAMCHGTTALGAPMLGNKDDWRDRIAQGKDTLHKHALEGFSGNKGVMPAKGGNPALDDDTVKAAVDYMVSQSQ